MYKPTENKIVLKHQDVNKIDKLNILCWNVAKLTKKEHFKDFFKKLVKDEKLNYFILQEVKSDISYSLDIFENYSFILSSNIQTKKSIYGVMNIFNISCEENYSLLSNKKEIKVATHKTILLTKHKLNGKNVIVVNIHALNFVPIKDFEFELNKLKNELINIDEPLIVAGDFNTWNKKRVLLLKLFCKELSLKEVILSDEKHIKKVFNCNLDYILYRGVTLEYSKAINSFDISDHNPLIASFTI